MEHEHELHAWIRRAGVVEAFSALAEMCGGPVIALDAAGRVVYWSEAAERRLGIPRDAVLQKALPKGILPDGPGRGERAVTGCRHYASSLGPPEAPVGSVHVMLPELSLEPAAPLGVPGDATDFHGILTRDPGMLRVFQVIRNVASTDTTVLVRGESGTGKELVARAIHLESHRRNKPFVAVNCAAFTATLLESELFGHVRGAFTGAVGNRQGIFAQADGGTLFLDEVAELPLETQAKLLRVLQERTFVPVGGTEPVQVDVRLVAATHRALRQEVRAGRFREDLMYRLRVVPIFLPPLRERRLDIDLLLRHHVDRANHRGPRQVRAISPEAMRALLDHDWPGNIRELQNVVEYAFAVGRGPEISLDELPPEFREGPEPAPATAGSERERVERAVAAAGGDLEAAATALGVSRTTFWRMRKRLGMA